MVWLIVLGFRGEDLYVIESELGFDCCLVPKGRRLLKKCKSLVSNLIRFLLGMWFPTYCNKINRDGKSKNHPITRKLNNLYLWKERGDEKWDEEKKDKEMKRWKIKWKDEKIKREIKRWRARWSDEEMKSEWRDEGKGVKKCIEPNLVSSGFFWVGGVPKIKVA